MDGQAAGQAPLCVDFTATTFGEARLTRPPSRDAGPRTGSPPRALPLGRLPRLLGARPVRWPLRDQVSACSSSASVHIVPWMQVWTAVASLTPLCRLLLPGFSSSRWAKSASFGSAQATVAHRRPPSQLLNYFPPYSPLCCFDAWTLP